MILSFTSKLQLVLLIYLVVRLRLLYNLTCNFENFVIELQIFNFK